MPGQRNKTVVLSANTSWYLLNFRKATIHALVDAGFEVACLAPQDEYSERLDGIPGCRWIPLEMDNQGSNPLREAALFLRFVKKYRQLQPVVVCHFTIKNNVYGTWAAALLRIPAINNITGLGTSFLGSGLVPRTARLLYRSSQRFAHTVFCQNPHDLAVVRDSGIAPAHRLVLVPGSGVDTTRFATRKPRESCNEFRFLFAGRMLKDKGLLELRSAMATLRESASGCTLWLCGFSAVDSTSSLTEKELQEWARESNVTWLGPSDAMEDVYAQVDCVVLPSYREGTPRSVRRQMM